MIILCSIALNRDWNHGLLSGGFLLTTADLDRSFGHSLDH